VSRRKLLPAKRYIGGVGLGQLAAFVDEPTHRLRALVASGELVPDERARFSREQARELLRRRSELGRTS
jgi:hypothetical protein